jgi:hypothetical protein
MTKKKAWTTVSLRGPFSRDICINEYFMLAISGILAWCFKFNYIPKNAKLTNNARLLIATLNDALIHKSQ